jgi:hypothetical protein
MRTDHFSVYFLRNGEGAGKAGAFTREEVQRLADRWVLAGTPAEGRSAVITETKVIETVGPEVIDLLATRGGGAPTPVTHPR